MCHLLSNNNRYKLKHHPIEAPKVIKTILYYCKIYLVLALVQLIIKLLKDQEYNKDILKILKDAKKRYANSNEDILEYYLFINDYFIAKNNKEDSYIICEIKNSILLH